MFVAIGYRRMRTRQTMFERAKEQGYHLASYVSPHAVVPADFAAGENNVLLDLVLVEPFASMGDNNVFWSGSIVCHDVRVGSHVYVGAKCVFGGRTRVDDNCFIGNDSTTINNVALGRETHLLPGSVVFQDTKPMTRYVGNPARAIGTHEEYGIVIERG